jgi:hypothetical protein
MDNYWKQIYDNAPDGVKKYLDNKDKEILKQFTEEDFDYLINKVAGSNIAKYHYNEFKKEYLKK